MNRKTLNIIIFLFAFVVNAQQDYSRNVVRNGNQVYLTGFKPMLQKGNNCSFYSTSMILAYYGNYIAPKKLSRNSNLNFSSTQKRSSTFMTQKLDSMGFYYFYTKEKHKAFFCEIIKFLIDKGIPMRWECNMRFSPRKKERSNSFHARIITGYIANKDKMTHILYTDSWGSGHINKLMDMPNAVKMTVLYGPIFPKKGNQQMIDELKNIVDELYSFRRYDKILIEDTFREIRILAVFKES